MPARLAIPRIHVNGYQFLLGRLLVLSAGECISIGQPAGWPLLSFPVSLFSVLVATAVGIVGVYFPYEFRTPVQCKYQEAENIR